MSWHNSLDKRRPGMFVFYGQRTNMPRDTAVPTWPNVMPRHIQVGVDPARCGRPRGVVIP